MKIVPLQMFSWYLPTFINKFIFMLTRWVMILFSLNGKLCWLFFMLKVIFKFLADFLSCFSNRHQHLHVCTRTYNKLLWNCSLTSKTPQKQTNPPQMRLPWNNILKVQCVKSQCSISVDCRLQWTEICFSFLTLPVQVHNHGNGGCCT